MNTISLTVSVVPTGARIGVNVDSSSRVTNLCNDIRARLPDVANVGNPNDYGIFVPGTDPKQAYWWDNDSTIAQNCFSDNIEVEYRYIYRRLIVRTLDDTKKTLQIDDSKTVLQLLPVICSKMGIANHEEYSLVRELDEKEKARSATLRKSKSLAKDYDKLEKMRQKLHTDDDTNWLLHSKSLRQQNVDESEVLLLRRKYFFSDQNVDSRDPVQLNLLYVQLKAAILNETHPITLEEAVQLAGIQCQVEFGNYVPEKMKNLNLDWKDFLPKEYCKVKGIDKKVLQHYCRILGLAEIEAKVRYIQLCRSLKTYGITFFLVKEKLKGKNKLTTSLLGISKESLMRVEDKTKEIVKTWPLTAVKRFAATANLFTVDFGQYSESNYVVQTTEGEQIAQLLSGYIDIIVKKQKATDSRLNEDDSNCTMLEDTVEPSKASVIAHQRVSGAQQPEEGIVALAGVMRTASHLQQTYTEGMISPQQPQFPVRQGQFHSQGHVQRSTQQFHLHDLDQPQRAFAKRIDNNLAILESVSGRLSDQLEFSNIGRDTASQRYRQQSLAMARSGITSNIGAMNVATGDLVSMTLPDNSDSDSNEGSLDYNLLNGAVTTIGVHMKDLVENVRLTAQMIDHDQDDDNFHLNEFSSKLLEATRNLSSAFQSLLRATLPTSETSDHPSRKEILDAANKVAEHSSNLIKLANQNDQSDSSSSADPSHHKRELLLNQAKIVASATTNLVMISKKAASSISQNGGDHVSSTHLINAAKMAGIATSQLVTCAKVVAATIDQPNCQKKLSFAAKQVGQSVECVLQTGSPLFAINHPIAAQMESCTSSVHSAVEKLLEIVQETNHQSNEEKRPILTLISSLEESGGAPILSHGRDSSGALSSRAHNLAAVSSQLVDLLQQHHHQTSADSATAGGGGGEAIFNRSNLLSATKALAEATSKLMEIAKTCSTSPPNQLESQEQALIVTVNHISQIIQNSPAAEIIRSREFANLESVCRLVITSANQAATLIHESVKHSTANNTQVLNHLNNMQQNLLPGLTLACSYIRQKKDLPYLQNDFVKTAQAFVDGYQQLLNSAQTLYPTVRDPVLQTSLNNSLQNGKSSLSQLSTCLSQIHQLDQYLPHKSTNPPSGHSLLQQSSQSWQSSSSSLSSNSSSIIWSNGRKPSLVTTPLLRELESGLERLSQVSNEVTTAESAVKDRMLLPLPGEKLVQCSANVASSVRNLQQCLPNFISKYGDHQLQVNSSRSTTPTQTSSFQRDPGSSASVSRLCETFISSISHLASGCRGLAAFQNGNDNDVLTNQMHILKLAHDVTTQAQVLLQHMKQGALTESSIESKPLDQLSTGLLHALSECVLYLPGRREIDQFSSRLSARCQQLVQSSHRPPPSTSPQENLSGEQLQLEFSNIAQNFVQLVSELAPAPDILTMAAHTEQISSLYDRLMDLGELVLTKSMRHSHPASSSKVTEDLLAGMNEISGRSRQLMELLKIVIQDGGSEASLSMYRSSLLQAANSVSESMRELVNVACSSVSEEEDPVKKQCDMSSRRLDTIKSRLNQPPSHPVTENGFYVTVEKLEQLYEEMCLLLTNIPNTASQVQLFCNVIQQLTDKSCQFIESGCQATYLIGVTDPRSDPGETIVHMQCSPLRDHQGAVMKACSVLSDPNTPEAKVREYASLIAKRAGATCQICKQLIGEFDDPNTRRQLVELAKEVARSTSILVSSVRNASSSNSTSSNESINNYLTANQNQWKPAANQVATNIDRLVTVLTNAPELSGQVARIAPEAKQAQQPLMALNIEIAHSVSYLIQSAISLSDFSSNQISPSSFTSFKSNKDGVTLLMQKFINLIKSLSPGQQQCREILQEISTILRGLNQAEINIASGNFKALSITNSNGTQNGASPSDKNRSFSLAITTLDELFSLVPSLTEAGKREAEKLGRIVTKVGSYLQPLIQANITCASSLRLSQEQSELMEQSKTILEAAFEVISLFQQSKGNPKMTSCFPRIDEASKNLSDACQDLSNYLSQLSERQVQLTNIVNTLSTAINKSNSTSSRETRSTSPDTPYTISQQIQQSARALILHSQELLAESCSRDSIGYLQLSSVANHTVQCATAMSQQAQFILERVNELANSSHSANVVNGSQSCAAALGDAVILQIWNQGGGEEARQVRQCVGRLMAALQSTAQSHQACSTAVDAVQVVIADLNTLAMFASSGSLMPEVVDQSESNQTDKDQSICGESSDTRDQILKSAKALVVSTRDLVTSSCGGGSMDEEKLTRSLSECTAWIQQLSASSKTGAASLSPDKMSLQVALINANLDVANSLLSLLQCTKVAITGEQQLSDNVLVSVKECAHSMVNNVTSLLKIVKTTEDLGSRGTRALESATDAMRADCYQIKKLSDIWKSGREFRNDENSSFERNFDPLTGPEDLIRATKPVMVVTAKALSASNTASQDEVLIAANEGRKAVGQLILQFKLILIGQRTLLMNQREIDQSDCRELERQIHQSVDSLELQCVECIESLVGLFVCLLQILKEGPKSQARSNINQFSCRIAESVHAITRSASQLKGSNCLPPEDLPVKAAEKLLGAASQIEVAARKLAQLKPRLVTAKPKPSRVTVASQKSDVSKSANQNFDHQILSSAKSVISQAADLVQAATVAQQELVSQGRLQNHCDDTDEEETQWSRGLISAAHLVAAAIENVCESADSLVRGVSSAPEHLISSSRQVASSTAQLLVACIVKADATSDARYRLQMCGAAVKRSTEHLVHVAQQLATQQREVSASANQLSDNSTNSNGSNSMNKPAVPAKPNRGVVNSMRQMMQTQASIEAREEELVQLRNKLNNIRHEQNSRSSSKLLNNNLSSTSDRI